MTAKDYRLLARSLANAYTLMPQTLDAHRAWAHTVHCLTAALANDNPKFKRDTFLAAVGAADVEQATV
jgi:hypothetical protein